MDGSAQLSAADRKWLLAVYWGSGAAVLARRAHVVLLVADGWSYRDIMACLFWCAGLTIPSRGSRPRRSRGTSAHRALAPSEELRAGPQREG